MQVSYLSTTPSITPTPTLHPTPTKPIHKAYKRTEEDVALQSNEGGLSSYGGENVLTSLPVLNPLASKASVKDGGKRNSLVEVLEEGQRAEVSVLGTIFGSRLASLSRPDPQPHLPSLLSLDIFGFERFEQNSLEQVMQYLHY